MLKIFVTGDNHIGLKYASHEKASVLAQKRISALEGMIKTANDENCGLFVITGDLFENTYSIAKKDIKAVVELMAQFKGIVAVLPGNHDYYDADTKLWQGFKEASDTKDNIMLLTEFRPYPVTVNGEEAVLYPAPCKSLHSAPEENNLGWIKKLHILPDSTYRVGIAHGSVEGETIDSHARYFMMKREELESIPVDVWLIGHTHIPFPREFTEDCRIFNAGTHVQTDVNCSTEGQCFIIELREDKSIHAKRVTSGNLRFYRLYLSLTAGEMERIIVRELAPLGDDSVVELYLSGAVTDIEYQRCEEFCRERLSRFIEGSSNTSSLSRLITKELIESEFAETSFSAGLLTALMDEPKEAQLAYELLKALKEGK